MKKKADAAATPAAAAGALACGKALAPPLLQCSKCKAEAYCCKACQVGDPAAPTAHRAPYASARSPAPAPFPPACTPPPPDCRMEGRAQARVRCARAGRGGAQLRRAARAAGPGGSKSRCRARAGGAGHRAEPTRDETK